MHSHVHESYPAATLLLEGDDRGEPLCLPVCQRDLLWLPYRRHVRLRPGSDLL